MEKGGGFEKLASGEVVGSEAKFPRSVDISKEVQKLGTILEI